MPRWLWTLLFVFLAGLVLAGGPARSRLPAALVDASGVACPMPPGYLDPAQPLQTDVRGQFGPQRVQGARIEPLAGLSLRARVLHREDYRFGEEARYSPTDLALGWGPMAEPGMARRLNITQGGRWYRYSWDQRGPPLPPGEVVRNSTNMHMVPADRSVARALSLVKPDETVRVDGWLIRIQQDDGWGWKSSTSRDDSGEGACELILDCSIRPIS
jgi:hypothetical protein